MLCICKIRSNNNANFCFEQWRKIMLRTKKTDLWKITDEDKIKNPSYRRSYSKIMTLLKVAFSENWRQSNFGEENYASALNFLTFRNMYNPHLHPDVYDKFLLYHILNYIWRDVAKLSFDKGLLLLNTVQWKLFIKAGTWKENEVFSPLSHL